ncbi:hypothetical protein OGAPHI_005994 [Ogataea philodendri]|uniref:Uncharacterized protein n=1 Tax=Ogataea philodendri TaxID=1378263 RepID=A0A9P8T0T8_9ASCO|nr:uncharacterized protein OGAPHI_005994 [Ogataea philodendri]KAH3661816.1 hypothetical protein OGAPHI_005994 [Ogataea philodendri]
MTAEGQYPEDSDVSGYTKVWSTLITNTKYLEGLLTLNFSLKKAGSKYPLVALYTKQLDPNSVKAICKRGISVIQIDPLIPTKSKQFGHDSRFYDTWSKLQPFKLVQFERVIQLDSDMVVIRNMDELMDFDLAPHIAFAAAAACVCNPLKLDHYPGNWVPKNCSFTNYHAKLASTVGHDHQDHHIRGPAAHLGLGLCNGGLLIVRPDTQNYATILETLSKPEKTASYDFPDQELLADVFRNRWVALSYKYNCLKTLKKCHSDIWNMDEIKNIHYIITPKPWEVSRESFHDETDTFEFWWATNDERLEAEKLDNI